MWYHAFEFYDRHSPATPDDITAFRTPLPEAEHANALNYLEPYSAQLSATRYCLPAPLLYPQRTDAALAIFRARRHHGQWAGFWLLLTGRNCILLFWLSVLVLLAQFAADCIRWRWRVLLLRFRVAWPFNCDERLRLG